MTSDVRELMTIGAMWKNGTPPVMAGLIDQTSSIVEACEFLWSEQAKWRAQKQMIEA